MAEYTFTGTLTRPNVRAPFQIDRMRSVNTERGPDAETLAPRNAPGPFDKLRDLTREVAEPASRSLRQAQGPQTRGG
ncbi:GTPase-activating protein that regulates ARFs [Microbacterium testaceum StLB037]|uniref:GTPase-activating protein that regulates ARFs n=1 Tax=Microbacterium testaceum (strain StLB037) TaxID=979556 RepID=E8NC84_MICTS|nr:GTPase-activating protein that regulates ARFs [Microbacterium testaceum StLB037]